MKMKKGAVNRPERTSQKTERSTTRATVLTSRPSAGGGDGGGKAAGRFEELVAIDPELEGVGGEACRGARQITAKT
jgi:hypothetical protein